MASDTFARDLIEALTQLQSKDGDQTGISNDR